MYPHFLRYSNYKHHEILGAVMPIGITANSGFERVGHIIHVNLLDEQKPFKNIIGQVSKVQETVNRPMYNCK